MTDKEKTTTMWMEGVEDALTTAEILFKNKVYHHALFYCQLALEKLLKAIWVKVNDEPAKPIHDLVDLAKYTHIKLTQQQTDDLQAITEFNLAARYDIRGGNFKFIANRKYFLRWYKTTKELISWLSKEHYHQN